VTNENAIANRTTNGVMERVIIEGDLSQLGSPERVSYYNSVCESLGLNPLTRPFEYLRLSGKLTLYAKKDAAEQLTRIHGISLEMRSVETYEDARIVTYRAHTPEGRYVDATGVVSVAGLKGDNLANAIMKTETKARRRATLALVGLGWLDETETETIPGAQLVEVDPKTGEIGESRPVRPISPQVPRTGAGGVPQGAEKGEWCEKHNRSWYLTKAMKANGFGYAHPPAAEGEPFCNQPKETITRRASGPAAASTTIDATALRDEIDTGEPHPADLA
jgi:hypothetical protein